jgi:hypothetical protein
MSNIRQIELTSESGVPRFYDIHNFEELPAEVAFVPELCLGHVIDEKAWCLTIQLAERMLHSKAVIVVWVQNIMVAC